MENASLVDTFQLKSNPTFERIFMLLEEGDYWRADNLCNQVLDQMPRCAEAFVGKLMAEIQIQHLEGLLTTNYPFTKSINYTHAVNYSTDPLRNFLVFAPYENFYLRGVKQMQSASTEAEFHQAAEFFKSISAYKDSSDRIRQCNISAEISRKDTIYARAIANEKLAQISALKSAIADFKLIPGWKDADQQVIFCNKRLHQLETERKRNIKNIKTISIIVCALVLSIYLIQNFAMPKIRIHLQYNRAISLMNKEDYQDAISAFESLNGYKDSLAQIEACNIAIKDQQYEEALSLYRDGKYKEATSAFHSLNGYKDSLAQIELCATAIKDHNYNAAVELYNSGKYEEAITAFEELGGYKDSLEQIELCQTAIKDQQYDAALVLYNNGNYEEAIEIYKTLNGFRDSKTKVDELYPIIQEKKYLEATSLMDNGKYKEAAVTFSSLNGYKDSDAKIKVIVLKDIPTASVRDYVKFGAYEQDDNISNGKEPIEWQVLEKTEDRVLLISRYALDAQPYNKEVDHVTWGTCSLRTWLNKDFLNNAFSIEERSFIAVTTVSADKNPIYSTSPGNVTQDKVFLLSIDEANRYFSSDSERISEATAYAIKQGAIDMIAGGTWWWLRSPGKYEHDAASISYDGYCLNNGHSVYMVDGVRPALWVNL